MTDISDPRQDLIMMTGSGPARILILEIPVADLSTMDQESLIHVLYAPLLAPPEWVPTPLELVLFPWDGELTPEEIIETVHASSGLNPMATRLIAPLPPIEIKRLKEIASQVTPVQFICEPAVGAPTPGVRTLWLVSSRSSTTAEAETELQEAVRRYRASTQPGSETTFNQRTAG